MPNFVQADRRRSDRANWDVVGKKRADEVRRWLAEFRRLNGWQPGMIWDPYTASYATKEDRPAKGT